MTTKLDVLAFGAHPDDVEACCGGTLAKCVKDGLRVGIIDLTEGDNSDYAGGSTRKDEANKAAKVLGIEVRDNLGMGERNLETSPGNEDKLVQIIRKYKPDTVFVPHWYDRHRGHRDTSLLLDRAIQSSKYKKIVSSMETHKVSLVLYYMIHYEFEKSFIFDISDTHKIKMDALFCHKSQLFKKDSKGRYTDELYDPEFIEAWEARSRWYGYMAGVKYGEAFAMHRPVGIRTIKSLTNLYL